MEEIFAYGGLVFWRIFRRVFCFPLCSAHSFRRPHTPATTTVNSQTLAMSPSQTVPITAISIYDAPTGENCLWTARGTCAAKQAKTLTITKGIFHTTLEEHMITRLHLTIQDYYLEIQINTNTPMSPRRTITPTGSAINAERLNGKTTRQLLHFPDNQTKAGTLTLSNNLTLNSTLTDRNNSTGTNNQISSHSHRCTMGNSICTWTW